MNRIDELFARKPSGILSLYFCAGYPTLGGTADMLRAMERGGIDMAEIGIPFSDPLADGPVIQTAATRALANGMSLHLLFEQLSDIRDTVGMPLILMGYLNPILHFGYENFFRKCNECGIDGVIIPDLPFADYMADVRPVAERYGLHVIMLITPETSDERIHLIDQNTGGFIYMVSSASTTGAQTSFDDTRTAYFRHVADMRLKHPCLVGFGISNRATLTAARQHSAGAIVGSRFVTLTAESATPDEAVAALLDRLSR